MNTTTVSDFDHPILPTLTIDSSLDFNGTFVYSEAEELLEVTNTCYTETSCGFFEDEFELEYIGFLCTGYICCITNDVYEYQTLVLS